jgi:hypothetical protein
MRLIDLISNLDRLDDDQMIFIVSNEPIREETKAVTDSIQKNVEAGEIPTGMKYFLEVPLAKEVVEVWVDRRNGKKPSLDKKFQAIVYYVTKDAYLPSSNFSLSAHSGL